eukprot:sb/3470736/
MRLIVINSSYGYPLSLRQLLFGCWKVMPIGRCLIPVRMYRILSQVILTMFRGASSVRQGKISRASSPQPHRELQLLGPDCKAPDKFRFFGSWPIWSNQSFTDSQNYAPKIMLFPVFLPKSESKWGLSRANTTLRDKRGVTTSKNSTLPRDLLDRGPSTALTICIVLSCQVLTTDRALRVICILKKKIRSEQNNLLER